MSFFAVLREGGQPDFDVEKLDVNLWCLPGLAGRYLFLCDVGVRFVAGDDGLTAFSVAVPFATDAEEMVDLVPRMINDPGQLNLVFGNAATPRRASSRCFYDDGNGEMALTEVHADRDSNSTAGLSVWRLRLDEPAPRGSSTYVRVRVPVRGLGRTWTWTSRPRRRSGALLDLRINELRETAPTPQGIDFPGRVKAVSSANCLTIIPASLQAERVSPDTHYVRVLEGSVWETYLGRAINLVTPSKLLVYFWRKREVTVDAPLRAFAWLKRATRFSLRAAASTAVLFALALVVLQDRRSVGRSLLADWGESLASYAADHVPAVTVVALLGLFLRVAPWIIRSKSMFGKARAWWRKFEHGRYEKRIGK